MVFDIIPWCNSSPATYAIIFFVLTVVFVVFNVIFSIYALYKMHHATKKSKMHKGIKILYIIINILFGSCGIGYISQISIGFSCGSYESWTTSGLIAHNSYFYGLTFLYLLYLIRLTFLYVLHSTIVLIIGLVGFILQFATHPFATYFFELDPPENYPLATMVMNIFGFINTVFSLFLLLLFWCKVKSLGKIHYSNSNSNIILGPAITYAFCALVSVFSTQIFNVVSFYRAYIDRDEHYFFLSMQYALAMGDASVNLVCLFFQFNFGKQYYLKYFGNMHSYVESKVLKKMSTTDKHKCNSSPPSIELKTTNSVISTIDRHVPEITVLEPQTQKEVTSIDIIVNVLPS